MFRIVLLRGNTVRWFHFHNIEIYWLPTHLSVGKGVKAKLKELERLAAQKSSPTTTTQAAAVAAAVAAAPAPLSAKDHVPPGLRPDISDLASMDVQNIPIPGGCFPLDASANATYMYNHHPRSSYPAVSGSGSLNIPQNLPVPFTNTLPVPEWTGDGRASPITNLLPQGYEDEIDSLGRYLEQHRRTIEGHDLHSHEKSSTTSSSWASSHRPAQSTDSSSIPDRIIIPSDSVSARENQISAGVLPTHTSLSKNGSRMSSGSPRLHDIYSDLKPNQTNNPSQLASTKTSRPRRRHCNAASNTTPTVEDLSIAKDEGSAAQLITAPLEDQVILPGVTRASVLETAQEMLADELDVLERKFTIHELIDAASEGRLVECFACGTAFFIAPIGEIHYKGQSIEVPLGEDNLAGEYTKKLRARLGGIMHGDVQHPWGYKIEETGPTNIKS